MLKRLLAQARKGAKIPALINRPKVPGKAMKTWGFFWDMRGQAGHRKGWPNPIQFSEIEAFARANGIGNLKLFSTVMTHLDSVFREGVQEKILAKIGKGGKPNGTGRN